MLGMLWLIFYAFAGFFLAQMLFSEQRDGVRIFLGLAMGLLLMMWTPAFWAFFAGFTAAAHVLAVLSTAGLCFAAYFYYGKKKGLSPVDWRGDFCAPDKALIILLVPLTLLTGYMMVTHYYQPLYENGVFSGLGVGQSTYGDLCLHGGIAAGLAEQGAFPPDYSILQGVRLAYPFLADAVPASLLLMGQNLQWAFVTSGLYTFIVTVMGFFYLGELIIKKWVPAFLATVLFFFNGGFGFLYFIDGVGFKMENEHIVGNFQNFTRIFTEFYQTPTNLADRNVRWVNVICDMLIPQRTTLFGWAVLFFALWLLYQAVTTRQKKYFVLTGITAGLMPLIHTHSFFALGMIGIAWFFMYYPDFKRAIEKSKETGKPFWEWIKKWIPFGVPAFILAVPQLIFWTFGQIGSGGFLRLQPGWVYGGREFFTLFWMKNLGLMAIVIVLVYFNTKNKELKRIGLSVLPIFIIAQLIIFQPNEYDNNKLLYVWYALTLYMSCEALVSFYRYLKGFKGRRVMAGIFIFLCVFSAVLSMGREAVSSYEIFSESEVAAADYVREKTPKDALILTWKQHNNAVTALAGRNIYAGTPYYLIWHGLSEEMENRQAEIQSWFHSSQNFRNAMHEKKFDYIYISSHERGDFQSFMRFSWDTTDVDAAMENLYGEPVFIRGNVRIYAVSQRAKEWAAEEP